MKKIIWIVVIVIAIVAILALVLLLLSPKRPENGPLASLINSKSKNEKPTLLIKNMPIKFAPYDSATGMAGDFKFTKAELQFDSLYTDFGFLIPASPDFPSKRSPQPAFLVPLGTKVRSIVDGEVVEIGKLYSNDYSIAVGSKNSPFRYETEHVINPIVKIGDKVKAGDIIADVSDYSEGARQLGLGVVEIGILKPGNPPSHLCPFKYLDPTVKDKIFNDLKTFYSDWNAYKGKTIYNLSDYITIGCLDEGNIEDNNDPATGNPAK